MGRWTLLAAAATAAIVLGTGIGWMLSGKESAQPAPEAKVAERELTTGSVAARMAASAPLAQPQATQSFPQQFPPAAAPVPPQARPAAAMPSSAPAKMAAARCANPDALGVARTVAIDTAGGP